MEATERDMLNRLSERAIGGAIRVSNTLGCGFLEKVYENAPALELRSSGLYVVQQAPILVRYRGEVVGEYFADLVIERCLIVETKAVKALDAVHDAQCLNYLRGSGLHLCLLINFSRPRLDIRRIVNLF